VTIDPNSLDDGQPHIVCRAWRALAALQIWAEGQNKGLTPPIPGQQPDPWVDGYRDWEKKALRFPAGPKAPSPKHAA
jgi:hypothetical protein